MIKVCLIGYGNWGKKVYQKTKDKIEYISILGKNDLINKYLSQVDWIIITTPTNTHYQIVKKYLNLKKNVFCEKPLSLNYNQVKTLYKIASKKDVNLIVSDFSDYKKKISFLKNNYFIRTKYSIADKSIKSKRIDLLYRFAYHDFGLIYNLVRNQKLISIKIHNYKKKLNFTINYEKNTFNFLYDSLNKKKKYSFNNKSLYQKNDLIKKMYSELMTNKKKFKLNKLRSLFVIKLIEKIKKKILYL